MTVLGSTNVFLVASLCKGLYKMTRFKHQSIVHSAQYATGAGYSVSATMHPVASGPKIGRILDY